ncbi:NAD(P)-dependent alcohol dehydrogenase [Subtercola sp. YIM 133946]|uniref:NAD(P)-dependent alcohol dehydrogenase n=1 Tax=Subtercola sp. YIM 133946 TaxID=3118909 RepID=UPI002F930515
MRVAQFFRYGGPEVVRVVEVDTPEPAADEVLVRVAATSVNPMDAETRAGRMRLLSGRRSPHGLGIDVAGTVERLGTAVATDGRFAVGDAVWGVVARFFSGTTGAAAEFMTVPARLLAIIPSSLDFIGAAALPAVGITAITAVRYRGRTEAGDRVLVRGAAGGVGSSAVQFAHSLGAHVTALASAGDLAWVRGLGADVALDRRATGPDDLGCFDVLVDTVGTELWRYRRLLAPGGRMVTIAFGSPADVLSIAASTIYGASRIRTFLGQPPLGMIDQLGSAVRSGAIGPQVGAVFDLDDIADAHRSLAMKSVRGKRVIRIGA